MFARGQTVLMLMLTALAPTLNAADEARPQANAVRTDRYGDPLPPGAVARLGTTRLYQSCIASTAFSPDGKRLASAGESSTYARLWDPVTGKEIRRLSGRLENQALEVVKFSPTGRLLAGVAPYEGRDIMVWDAATGKLLHRLPAPKNTNESIDRKWNIAFVEGDKTLVSVDAEVNVRWWDVATGAKVREWNATQEIAKPNGPGSWKFNRTYHATLTRDGQILAAILRWENEKAGKGENPYQFRLIVWDLVQRKQRWNLARRREDAFAFDLSADGKIVALFACEDERFISIRDGITGGELRRIKVAKKVFDDQDRLALSADGTLVAAVGEEVALLDEGVAGVRVWEVGSGKLLHQLRRQITHFLYTSRPRPVFSPDGGTLAFARGYTLALLDVRSGSERLAREGHREPVLFLSFSDDLKTLVSGNEGPWPPWSCPQTGVIWDMSTWREKTRTDCFNGVADRDTLYVSRDHRLGVVQTNDGDLFLVERGSGKKKGKLPIQSCGQGGFFSPSGKTVGQIYEPNPDKPSDWSLALVDVASGKKWSDLPEEAQRILMAFSPDDRLVAWLDKETIIHLIEVQGGKELHRLRKPRREGYEHNVAPNLTFSPDGRYLSSWDRDVNDILIWDCQTGKEYRRLPGRASSSLYQVRLTYSPDGRCLAVGGMAAESEIELWELATGQLRRRIPGHLDLVRSLAFSPDGRLLASGSEDTTILVWDLYGFSLRDRSVPEATLERLRTLWAELAHTDARHAGAAMTDLLQRPQQASSLFTHKLQPVSAVAPEKVARAIADLDGNEFAVREKAARELEQFADLAERALRKTLANKPSLEARRRIETLLDRLDHLPPERLREVRAVEVLELLGTPEARELLRRLAGGAPEARLTREAKSSLERLARRPAVGRMP